MWHWRFLHEEVWLLWGRDMRTYIYGLILVGVSATLVEMLSPGGEEHPARKHLKFVIGLCVLLVCIKPLGDGILYIQNMSQQEMIFPWGEGLPQDEAYQGIFDNYISDISGEQIASWVKSTLQDEFGITKEISSVEVVMGVAEGVPVLKEVYITLKAQAIFQNPHQIEKHIAARLACPCHVAIDINI